MTVMTALQGQLAEAQVTLDTLTEPTYIIAEQGGFKDATIAANFTDGSNLRLAAVNIDDRYLGDVRSAIGQQISVQQQLPRAAPSKQQPCMCTYLQVKLRLLPPPVVLLCCPLHFQLLCSMLSVALFPVWLLCCTERHG